MLNIFEIKKILEKYHPKKIENGLIEGAVIVPLFRKNNELFILLTKRTEIVSTHKGEISFPGGKMDEKDKSLYHCALREIYEEIGVKPNKIQLLGELDQIRIITTNVKLTPFVCELNSPFNLKINDKEVQEIIIIPLKEFFNNNYWKLIPIEISSININEWYFYYNNWIIWGATARIIKQFISLFNLII